MNQLDNWICGSIFLIGNNKQTNKLNLLGCRQFHYLILELLHSIMGSVWRMQIFTRELAGVILFTPVPTIPDWLIYNLFHSSVWSSGFQGSCEFTTLDWEDERKCVNKCHIGHLRLIIHMSVPMTHSLTRSPKSSILCLLCDIRGISCKQFSCHWDNVGFNNRKSLRGTSRQ